MNRETKIGLVTGLGVIVLIGVLLSEYLNPQGRGTPPVDLTRTYGEGYRQVVEQPVGVPPADLRMARGGNGVEAPPLAFAKDGSGTGTNEVVVGPVVGAPAVPVPAGPIPKVFVTGPGTGRGPLELADGAGKVGDAVMYVPLDPSKAGKPEVVATGPGAVPAGEMYKIGKGDTLTAIAKKFYRAATKADVARIVAANPALLKDEKTGLVVGKQLIIPPAPKPVVVAKTESGKGEGGKVDAKKGGRPTAVVGLPGGTAAGAGETVGGGSVKVEEPKVATYTVKAGDSLEKIAKKYLGSGSRETVARIVVLNKIEDAASIQVGMVLRIPAKEAAKAESVAKARG